MAHSGSLPSPPPPSPGMLTTLLCGYIHPLQPSVSFSFSHYFSLTCYLICPYTFILCFFSPSFSPPPPPSLFLSSAATLVIQNSLSLPLSLYTPCDLCIQTPRALGAHGHLVKGTCSFQCRGQEGRTRDGVCVCVRNVGYGLTLIRRDGGMCQRVGASMRKRKCCLDSKSRRWRVISGGSGIWGWRGGVKAKWTNPMFSPGSAL